MLTYASVLSCICTKHTSSPLMQILDWHIISTGSESETWVLAHKDSKLYIGIKKGSMSAAAIDHADPSTWTDTKFCKPPEEVDPAKLYPEVRPGYTRFRYRKGEDPNDVHKKHQTFLDVGPRRGFLGYRSDRVARITAREIDMCERLRARPHANIAEYRGVQTGCKLTYEFRGAPVMIPMEKERVVNLVFKRYYCTLHEFVLRRHHLDVRYCLNSIAAGIRHLHSLGITHQDIKPHNIFVHYPQEKMTLQTMQFVVGDFDSCHYTGSTMTMKCGTRVWTHPKLPGRDVAEEDDDWYAFQKLKEWLVKETRGRLQEYDGIGKKIAELANP